MKTAVITGGTGAIGSALTAAFSADYEVVFTYNKNVGRASRLAEKYGARAVRCDVSDRSDVEKLAGQCENVSLLINNAGIAGIQLFTDTTDADWDRMLAVNLTGAFNITKAFLPQMISRKNGCIINISSVWGVHGASCEVAYSASKAGLIGFTKALAKETGPSLVRVNAIAPGVIESEMNSHLTGEELRALADNTPLGRIGTPDDVAKAALLLEKADFVTGQILGVDGGFY